ncbi:hypothetical protein Pcinc_002625 [Petrolisthes cinctipes]|uniref:Uncharacterized protein n=1 Tax=Petrolisthes cinctipes TaxID=88211 RepID=A0AAE1L5A1_PETCI|nr:hypothetical protein Pcinc_008893 [Petrolisthes cinctipes]KAK3893560.1 hypothetical protein Pcinc_002625 [Petrolisthes cinctipes]
MQPLDVSYFKSFKAAYNRAADNWMVTNAGKRISQFDVVGIFAIAIEKSATMGKAVNGFRVTGLWRFNDNIFTEDDFAAAHLTEEEPPEPNSTNTDNNNNTPTDDEQHSEPSQSPQPGTSKEIDAQELLTSLCRLPTSKQKRERKRKAEKATVITSSPYKKQLIKKKSSCTNEATNKSSKKKALSPVSSKDEEWPCLVC